MIDNLPLAVGYYTLAAGFREGAEKIVGSLEVTENGQLGPQGIIFYYLTSHAAELFLKGALLKRGYSESVLKKYDYRHNLSSLLDILLTEQVILSQDTITTVRGLSDQHKNHVLRYSILFGEHKVYWPPIGMIYSMLDELLLSCKLSAAA